MRLKIQMFFIYVKIGLFIYYVCIGKFLSGSEWMRLKTQLFLMSYENMTLDLSCLHILSGFGKLLSGSEGNDCQESWRVFFWSATYIKELISSYLIKKVK